MRLNNDELNALRIAMGMFIANIKNEGPTKKLYVGLNRQILAECHRRSRSGALFWIARAFIALGVLAALAITAGVFAIWVRS